VRAYARTVRHVFRKPADVGREAVRLVDVRAANSFRRVTAVLFAIPFAVPSLALWWMRDEVPVSPRIPGYGQGLSPEALDLVLPSVVGSTAAPVAPVYVLLTAAACCGVASWWFRFYATTPDRRDRAASISAYACAPLALMLIPFVLALVIGAVALAAPEGRWHQVEPIVLAIWFAGVVVCVVAFVSWWLGTLRMLKASTGSSGGMVALAAVGWPLSCIAAAALTLVALPWVVGFFLLVWQSFG
jgi:hypothetical protein